MTIPGKYTPSTRQDRIRAKARINREADRKRCARALSPIQDMNRKPLTIMLVLGIMSVVGALLVWQSNTASKTTNPGRSREDIAEDELYVFRIALELFKNDSGRYPTSEEHLEALVLNPGITNWGGHYVSLVRADPWKRRYHYEVSTNGAVLLFSGGRDRIPGTEDDVIATELSPEEIAENIKLRAEYRRKKGYW